VTEQPEQTEQGLSSGRGKGAWRLSRAAMLTNRVGFRQGEFWSVTIGVMMGYSKISIIRYRVYNDNLYITIYTP